MAAKKNPWIKKITGWIKDSFSFLGDEPKAPARKKKKAKHSASKSSVKPALKKKAVSKKIKKPAARMRPKTKKPLVKKTKRTLKPQKPGLVSAPRKKAAKPVLAVKAAPGICIGKVAYYFPKAEACAFKVEKKEFKQGAVIRIVGPATDFKMTVKSIQINRIPVPTGRPGEDVGIGVAKPVNVGDSIYLI